VVFLTARDQLQDVLAGFAAGGDDHVTKPFHVSELHARLRVALRRAGAAAPAPTAGLWLDPAQHALAGTQGQRSLTPTEYRLLAALMGAGDTVVRRRELIRAGWPDGAVVAENTLDQYVARLRRKLGELAAHEHTIATVHGVGYRFS
jgi:two-component system response regulator MprA